MKNLQRLAWLILIISLGACGFRLRGVSDLPPYLDHVGIIIQDAHRELGPLLQEQLLTYHRSVESDPARAGCLLVIERDALTQNITSISSSTTPRQYELIYTVQFKLQRKDGRRTAIVPSRRVTITRSLTINSDRILGSNDEEAHLAQEMRQQAAIMILNRLGTLAP